MDIMVVCVQRASPSSRDKEMVKTDPMLVPIQRVGFGVAVSNKMLEFHISYRVITYY